MTAHDQVRSLCDEIRDICAAHGVKTCAMDKLEVLTEAYMHTSEAEDWGSYRLSKSERRITELLYQRMGRYTTKEAMLSAIFFDALSPKEGGDHLKDPDKLIHVHLFRARKKLEQRNAPYRIENDWGVGYRMTRKA